MSIALDGSPAVPFSFSITLTEEQEETDCAEGYGLEVKITTAAVGASRLWRPTDGFTVRAAWNTYKLSVPCAGFTRASGRKTVTVDAQWWRDLARTMPATTRSLAVTCVLQWEGGGTVEGTVNVTLQNALAGLTLLTQDPCFDNGSTIGEYGFGHKQVFTVGATGNGKYAIVQWVRGIFVHWKNAGIDSLVGETQRAAYAYLQIPSCGANVDGYMPMFAHDGSRARGWPNFYNENTGVGTDAPGDAPGTAKIWGIYDRELMLVEFVTQVYLACDIDGAPSYTVTQVQDRCAKNASTHRNIRYRSSDYQAEVRGATLPVLADGDWIAGILQIKGAGASATAHNVGILNGALVAPHTAGVPTLIKNLTNDVFAAHAGSTAVVME